MPFAENTAARQRGIARRFVDVRHGNGEGFIDEAPSSIAHPNRDVVRGVALEVELTAVGDRDHAGVGIERKAPAGIVEKRIGQDRPRIRIGARNRADRGAVCGILRNTAARQRGVGRGLR